VLSFTALWPAKAVNAFARTAALPPDYCAFGDSFAIVLSHLRIKLRRLREKSIPQGLTEASGGAASGPSQDGTQPGRYYGSSSSY
jgi:adenylosuccinate lyase